MRENDIKITAFRGHKGTAGVVPASDNLNFMLFELDGLSGIDFPSFTGIDHTGHFDLAFGDSMLGFPAAVHQIHRFK